MTYRPDQNGRAKAAFQKAKRLIYSTQNTCAICGRAVNFDLTFPNPWSATLDHIIPVAKGGDPASIDNLQLAHLQCNRMKGTRVRDYNKKEKLVSNRDLPLSRDWTKPLDIE